MSSSWGFQVKGFRPHCVRGTRGDQGWNLAREGSPSGIWSGFETHSSNKLHDTQLEGNRVFV
jgi:hypothetical protein